MASRGLERLVYVLQLAMSTVREYGHTVEETKKTAAVIKANTRSTVANVDRAASA